MKSEPTITQDELTELEIKILQNIGVGHRNAIPLKVMVQTCGTREERKVRLAIESLRNHGYLVLFGASAPQGYYLAETPEDVQEFIDYMKERVIAECRIMRSLKLASQKKFTRQFGQLPMFMS